MHSRRPILIQCPHFQRRVPGTYEAGPDGQYRLAEDGSFVLGRACCNQNGGRCMETLCALHRHNRRGRRTWYPERVLATGGPGRDRGRPTAGRTVVSSAGNPSGKLDLLC